MHKEVGAPASPYLPAAQMPVQFEEDSPVVLPYRPAGQGAHKVAPGLLAYKPAAQGVLTPWMQEFPTSQGLHCETLVAAASVE